MELFARICRDARVEDVSIRGPDSSVSPVRFKSVVARLRGQVTWRKRWVR